MCIDIVAIGSGGEIILVKLTRIKIGQQLPFDVCVLLSKQVFPSARFALIELKVFISHQFHPLIFLLLIQYGQHDNKMTRHDIES